MTTGATGEQLSPEAFRKDALTRFNALLDQLAPLLEKLRVSPTFTLIKTPGVKHVPAPMTAGVYLFSENGVDLYVGRTKNFRRRLGEHSRPGSHENSAPFAFNIAKRAAEESGFPATGRTRKALDADQDFNEKFFAPAKDRVRRMEFRVVEFDPDATDADELSTIFEVYAAVLLGTNGDFNLLGTH